MFPLTYERLDAILSRIPKLRIAVIGDFFLDKYLVTDPALASFFTGMGNVPFMNRMGYIFLICTVMAILASLLQKPKPEAVTVDVQNVDYSTTMSFKIASGAIIAILIALYATWW